MNAVMPFTGVPLPSDRSMPTILVSPTTENIAQANQVIREVRRLGYRIVDIDVVPNDGGSPIIQIDLVGLSDRSLAHLATVIVRNKNTGYDRATIDGVRVCWAWSD